MAYLDFIFRIGNILIVMRLDTLPISGFIVVYIVYILQPSISGVVGGHSDNGSQCNNALKQTKTGSTRGGGTRTQNNAQYTTTPQQSGKSKLNSVLQVISMNLGKQVMHVQDFL